MSRMFLFIVLSCLAAACGDSPTAPTTTQTPTTTQPGNPTPGGGTTNPTGPGTPAGPTAPANVNPTPISGVTVTSSHADCATLNPADVPTWEVGVVRAPRPLHLLGYTFHSKKASCEDTSENGRQTTLVRTGPQDYKVGDTDTTRYAFRADQYNCGRIQFDVGNNGEHLYGQTLKYPTDCPDDPPAPIPTPTPTPVVKVTANGACSVMNVTADGIVETVTEIDYIDPAALDPNPVVLNFTAAGTKPISVLPKNYRWKVKVGGVVVASGEVTDCELPPPATLTCAPPRQTVNIGQTANTSATGGTGVYSWAAPYSTNATGSGASFATTYVMSGTFDITVTSGEQTATCQVMVPPPVCVPQRVVFPNDYPNNLIAVGPPGYTTYPRARRYRLSDTIKAGSFKDVAIGTGDDHVSKAETQDTESGHLSGGPNGTGSFVTGNTLDIPNNVSVTRTPFGTLQSTGDVDEVLYTHALTVLPEEAVPSHSHFVEYFEFCRDDGKHGPAVIIATEIDKPAPPADSRRIP